MKITVEASAKVNLSLDILGRLENGYHALSMVMQSISLNDTITVETLPEGSVRILSCNMVGIPCDERNIAWRAADAFFKAAALPPIPVAIHIEKKIPSQAGLGGGSADGAAVLHALQLLCGSPLSMDQLLEVGLSVGADIPFCLTGGTALAEGVGEKLTPLPPMPDCILVLTQPETGMSTAAAYASYDKTGSDIHPNTGRLRTALSDGNLLALAEAMENTFESLISLPEIAELRHLMLSSGALGSRMSGSGSAVFSVFTDSAAAEFCVKECINRGLWADIASPTRQSIVIKEAAE